MHFLLPSCLRTGVEPSGPDAINRRIVGSTAGTRRGALERSCSFVSRRCFPRNAFAPGDVSVGTASSSIVSAAFVAERTVSTLGGCWRWDSNPPCIAPCYHLPPPLATTPVCNAADPPIRRPRGRVSDRLRSRSRRSPLLRLRSRFALVVDGVIAYVTPRGSVVLGGLRVFVLRHRTSMRDQPRVSVAIRRARERVLPRLKEVVARPQRRFLSGTRA